MAGLVLCIIGKRMEASKADSLALGSASHSLPLGSIDDSLNGEWFFPLALKEGHLLLTYAHPLKGASLHVCNTLFVKSGEQRWTPSQYCLQQPVRFFSPTLKTFVVSQWQGIGCQPSCSPLGRRAELPIPTLSHCWRPLSETCWQAATIQAGKSRAWLPSLHLWNRSLQNTRHLTGAFTWRWHGLQDGETTNTVQEGL